MRSHTDKDCIIAGGCLRDYALELKPKDIDIFVACGTREELEQLGDKLNASGIFDVAMIEPGEWDAEGTASQGSGVPDLVGVLDGEAFGLPVNVIARCDHIVGRDELMAGFDFNILKAFAAGECPTWTHEALTDISQRVATLAHQRSIDISYKRFDRFSSRNPGVLKMVDPWQLSLEL